MNSVVCSANIDPKANELQAENLKIALKTPLFGQIFQLYYSIGEY